MAEVQTLPQAIDCQYLIPKDVNSAGLASWKHAPVEQRKQSIAPAPVDVWTPPSSRLTPPKCHPRVEEVSHEVNEYFLKHWEFPTAKSRKVFLAAGFPRVTCLYFPLAKDDRIHFACRLLTVLFLIDDVLEDMSFAEGEAYNAKLIPIARGDVLPNRKPLQVHLGIVY